MMEELLLTERPILRIGKESFSEFEQKNISVLEEYGATVLSLLGTPTKGEVTFYHGYEGRHEVELWVSGVNHLDQYDLDRLAEGNWRVKSMYPSDYKEGMMVQLLRNTECDGSKFTDDSLYQAIGKVNRAIRGKELSRTMVHYSNEKKGLYCYYGRDGTTIIDIVEGDATPDWDALNSFNKQKESSQ